MGARQLKIVSATFKDLRFNVRRPGEVANEFLKLWLPLFDSGPKQVRLGRQDLHRDLSD